MKVLAVLCLLTGSALAQMPGRCSIAAIPSQPAFSPADFEGEWYEQRCYYMNVAARYLHQDKSYNVQAVAGGLNIKVNSRNIATQRCDPEVLQPRRLVNNARYTYIQGGQQVTSIIVFTDYHTVAVEIKCLGVIGDICNAPDVSIWTRKRVADPLAVALGQRYLTACVNPTVFKIIQQDPSRTCNRKLRTPCPWAQVQAVPYTSQAEQLTGLWYETLVWPSTYEELRGSTVQTGVVYSTVLKFDNAQKPIVGIAYTGKKMLEDRCISPVKVEIADAMLGGRLEYNFPNFFATGTNPMKAVYFDGNMAAYYICNDLQGGDCKNPSLRIHTKSATITPEQRRTAEGLAARLCVDPTAFFLVDHHPNCVQQTNLESVYPKLPTYPNVQLPGYGNIGPGVSSVPGDNYWRYANAFPTTTLFRGADGVVYKSIPGYPGYGSVYPYYGIYNNLGMTYPMYPNMDPTLITASKETLIAEKEKELAERDMLLSEIEKLRLELQILRTRA